MRCFGDGVGHIRSIDVRRRSSAGRRPRDHVAVQVARACVRAWRCSAWLSMFGRCSTASRIVDAVASLRLCSAC